MLTAENSLFVTETLHVDVGHDPDHNACVILDAATPV
jgi:hypothetical protein